MWSIKSFIVKRSIGVAVRNGRVNKRVFICLQTGPNTDVGISRETSPIQETMY